MYGMWSGGLLLLGGELMKSSMALAAAAVVLYCISLVNAAGRSSVRDAIQGTSIVGERKTIAGYWYYCNAAASPFPAVDCPTYGRKTIGVLPFLK